ncbi:MAG: DUF167 domain-containing protein [Elusimicrobia bacterium]|nr:DUF167 domain-containing protein [Elusimicrobiota bacterium]
MLIKLKVHPDSKRSPLVRRAPDSFEIWVKAPAREGLANKAALAALAEALGQPPRKLHIVKGAASPSKIVKVLGA